MANEKRNINYYSNGLCYGFDIFFVFLISGQYHILAYQINFRYMIMQDQIMDVYKWYIIHTHYGFELKVINNIKEEIGKRWTASEIAKENDETDEDYVIKHSPRIK